jgi:predicted HicB family RNase H-like nuclease
MSNAMTATEESNSTNHLKSIFDQSLAVLCEDSANTGSQTKRQRRSSLPLHVDAVNLHKRALDNAAKALASLWKISEPKRPKLQSRVPHYSRSTS